MICDFEVVSVADKFRHTCRRCGVVRIVAGARLVRRCQGETSHGTIAFRINICRNCSERPNNCWKAVEYGCELDRQKAARLAAETGDCPIGKLK